MKKRLLMIFVAMLLLVGCGNNDTPETGASTQQTEAESTRGTFEKDTEEETTEAESKTTTKENTEVESETTTESEKQTETQTESEMPSEEPQTPTYTYTDLDKKMYAKSSVNVRDLPSTDGNRLGGLSKAQEVHVTGQCNETSWYRIEYNGGIGYVSGSYLLNEKPVEEVVTTQSNGKENTTDNTQGATDNTQSTTNSTSNEACPYDLYVIYYDNQGYPYFYGKFGGSGNMDSENWTKTSNCMEQSDRYMGENYQLEKEDGTWSEFHTISWKNIGVYDGVQIVLRYIDSVNGVELSSPEARGISTAGNGKWE